MEQNKVGVKGVSLNTTNRIINIIRVRKIGVSVLTIAILLNTVIGIRDLSHNNYNYALFTFAIVALNVYYLFDIIRYELRNYQDPFYTLVRVRDGKRFKPVFSYSWRNHLTHPVQLISLDETETTIVYCAFYNNDESNLPNDEFVVQS
jgi:hypothetical protein